MPLPQLPEQKLTYAKSQVFPVRLSDLARLVQVGPPLLSSLLELLVGTEQRIEFLKLVAEYMPDQLDEIRRVPGPVEAVNRFIVVFSARYYPLDDVYADEGYEELLNGIPIPRLGIGWDDYHMIENYRPGIQAMMALIANPYGEFGEGARVPLLQAVAAKIGKRLAQRIPKGGFALEELVRVLQGTPYAGVPLLAKILYKDSDNVFLDLSWEEELYDNQWSRELVDSLTPQWPQARQAWDVIDDLAERIESEKVMPDLLELLLKTREKVAGKTLVEIFSHPDDEKLTYTFPCGCVVDVETEELTSQCGADGCMTEAIDGVQTIAEEEGYDLERMARRVAGHLQREA